MESVIPILPLYFAAPMSWYLHLLDKEKFMLMDDARFPKQTNRQRFSYATVEGPQTFTIPLVKHTRNLNYRSVEISYQEHWQNQLINALKTSYGKTPFFEYYDYRFEQVLREKHQYLWDLNFSILQETLKCLRFEAVPEIFSGALQTPEPEFEDSGKPYYQVFADKTGFLPNMCILDLIFNEGSNAWHILSENKK